MAIVFISPKQRQQMFFAGITVMFLLLLTVISFGVFLSKPQEFPPEVVFNKAKVDINMSVFDSEEFLNLEPFPEIQLQYTYKAITKNKKEEIGFVSASSIEEAKAILTGRGLSSPDVKEVEIGRNNPFASYYKVLAAAASKAKK